MGREGLLCIGTAPFFRFFLSNRWNASRLEAFVYTIGSADSIVRISPSCVSTVTGEGFDEDGLPRRKRAYDEAFGLPGASAFYRPQISKELNVFSRTFAMSTTSSFHEFSMNLMAVLPNIGFSFFTWLCLLELHQTPESFVEIPRILNLHRDWRIVESK